MTKEQIIEDICATFKGSKKRLVKSWNAIFPEEKLGSDIRLSQELREEMTENIREELEYSDDFEILSKLYKFCTGEPLSSEDVYSNEDIEFEDDLYS